MIPLSLDSVEALSHTLFENTFKYRLSRELISRKTGVSSEDVLRLQSGNPFVSQESFDKVKAYMGLLSNSIVRGTREAQFHSLKKTSVNINRSVTARKSQAGTGSYFGASSALQKSVLIASSSGSLVTKVVGKSFALQGKLENLTVSNVESNKKNGYYKKFVRDSILLEKAPDIKSSMFNFSSTKTSAEEYVLSSYATTNGR